MSSTDLVIFDCDGVLVDSEIVAARVEAELLSAAGFQITAEELAQTYAGLTFKDIMLRIEAEAQQVFQASLIGEAEALVNKRLGEEVEMIAGADAAVRAVKVPYCICSNSGMERLQITLTRTGLFRLFDGRIFPAADTPSGKGKPAPDVFLHAAKAMKANPARTFVVEDSVHGVAGARAAGMRVIGFTGASHSYAGHADLLTEAGAETVISRLSDLAGVLDALALWSEDA
jgi:HAD superfamily hydrolase (TIGR01509 family)